MASSNVRQQDSESIKQALHDLFDANSNFVGVSMFRVDLRGVFANADTKNFPKNKVMTEVGDILVHKDFIKRHGLWVHSDIEGLNDVQFSRLCSREAVFPAFWENPSQILRKYPEAYSEQAL